MAHGSKGRRSTYERYSGSFTDPSFLKYDGRSDLKCSSLYPEFVLVRGESESVSTEMQGSLCTDFVFAGGDIDNLHDQVDLER